MPDTRWLSGNVVVVTKGEAVKLFRKLRVPKLHMDKVFGVSHSTMQLRKDDEPLPRKTCIIITLWMAQKRREVHVEALASLVNHRVIDADDISQTMGLPVDFIEDCLDELAEGGKISAAGVEQQESEGT